ncbi:zinc-binding alcohol dehydrogenase [Paenibacillus sp. IB182496]|uniref:Zinc-binding alcohol dehydrogenase n=2 Tax=Paenibacillus sabuli TaxID=2772509 RepID=A0A927BY15_9BACL|nr:zinc-binding alcohol dehydrogenase [Paenibacillus sabuli]
MVYEGPKRIKIANEPSRAVGPEEVRVRTLYSGISHGTEMQVYRGQAPFFRRRKNPRTGLFEEGGEAAIWTYPIRSSEPGVWYMGYACVGEVVETGADANALRRGDLVYVNAPHQSEVVCAASAAIKLPEAVNPERAVLLTNLLTAFNSVLDSRIKLGDTVVVSGLGVMGQLILRLVKRSGAGQTIGVDVIPARLEAAKAGGADHVFNAAGEGDVALEVRGLTDNRGADLVLEASGSQRALQQAIRIAGYDTTVTTVGWYPGQCEALNLSEEYHHNRVALRSSHTGGTDPAIAGMWTQARKTQACLELLGELPLEALITHRVPYGEIADAYAQIDTRPDAVIQVVLTYD